MNYKRLIAGIFSVAMIGSSICLPTGSVNIMNESVSVAADAADIIEFGDYSYRELSEGKVEIVKYNGKSTSVTVPSTISGKTVTGIGYGAFEKNKTITDVILPKTVTTIGDRAFHGCTGLTEVRLPDHIKSIGEGAFAECTEIEDLRLSNSLEEIPGFAFFGCNKLKSVKLPNNVKSIGINAFEDCEALEVIYIPPSVTEIGDEAFKGCPELVIYGEKGSYAETYANEHGYKFRYYTKTTASRLTRLQSYMLGKKGIDITDLDLNEDGVVDIFDYIIARKLLFLALN